MHFSEVLFVRILHIFTVTQRIQKAIIKVLTFHSIHFIINFLRKIKRIEQNANNAMINQIRRIFI